MIEQVKLKCLGCEEIYYLMLKEAEYVVPDGVAPGEAFKSVCPHCDERTYAKLVE